MEVSSFDLWLIEKWSKFFKGFLNIIGFFNLIKKNMNYSHNLAIFIVGSLFHCFVVSYIITEN